ncbi:hypothetical protein [Pseudomonas putida]|uniref:Uncharacterized protein n=1 Tax=Pseudomonas putida TaxID=303 RepID=A0A177SMU5_PSEPU|nr:hypothetical protein [Pseudomonas putida]OAI91576.1 hypothetical protein AYO28_20445 [Pseudomonas putida]
MQAQHFTLAAGIALILGLVVANYLFARTRVRAYEHGRTDGLKERDAMAWKKLQALDLTLAERAVAREQEQRQYLHSKAAMQATIDELEARVRAYTGLAVTPQDHQLLTKAAETLDIAYRTFSAIKGTEAWQSRAGSEAAGLRKLAELMHAEIREKAAITPAKSEVLA